MEPSDRYRPLSPHDFAFFGFDASDSNIPSKLARLGTWSAEPTVAIHEDVIYIPATGRRRSAPQYAGGFISTAGEPLAWSDLRRKGSAFIGSLPERIDLESWQDFDGEAIYLGWLFDHFGHFMVESLARSWFLAECSASRPVLFHAPLGKIPVGTIQHALDWIGIPANRILVPTRATRFRRVLVPDSLHELHFRVHEQFPAPYRDVARRLLADGPAGTSDQPVYISRRLLPNDKRALIGEWELEEVLQENGFLIARPETMTFADQVRLFNRHRDIVAVEQSALNQILFALGNPHIHCVATSGLPLGDFFLLPKVSGADATFINAATERGDSLNTGRQGPQLLSLAKLLEYLDQRGFLQRRIRSELAKRLDHLERSYDDEVLYRKLTSATRSGETLSPELARECELRAAAAWPISAALSRYYRDHDVDKCKMYALRFIDLVRAEHDLDRLARYQPDMERTMASVAQRCGSQVGDMVRQTVADKFSV
jgi:hypothetical protein